ncbi:hypothetical protein I8H83_03320 [Candidatus Saccharibacteria bacterium]|nr:hypothetical protein [Candidatus Saccharibacteria bacterium]
MFKRIAIILGSIILAGLVVGAISFYVTGESNPETANKLMIQTAYLAKSKESYARCYNSINYGTSLIGDIRLEIKGENFNNDSITSDRLDEIEASFMDTVKLKCQKTVDEYQSAYDDAVKYHSEIESSNNGLWNILFGSADSPPSTQDLGSFEPAYVRMSIAFNDYVFSEQDVEEYFKKELSL